MTVDDNLFLENIKALRADIGGVRGAVEELQTRISRVEIRISGQRREMALDAETVAHQQATLDRFDKRIDRIERCLELVSE